MEGRASRNNRHNRRFRASCDQCTDSKLKCDQVKPQCNRCTSRGRACVYSLIRAVGRPPRSSTCAIDNRRGISHEAESGNRLGRDAGPQKNVSQTGAIDIDKEPTIQESPNPRTPSRQLPSPDETTSISESSPCQKSLDPHMLDFSVDGNFDFTKEPFEPLEVFSFDDVSFDDVSFNDIADPHRQSLDGKNILANNACCLNQLDTGSLAAQAVYDSSNTSANDFITISPGTRSATLIKTLGSATPERSAAKAKDSNPLFSVDSLCDIAPSRLHSLILQICPEVQPNLQLPLTLGETHDSGQCICPALVGSLQVFASNPALCAGPQWSISLDLLLLLDDHLSQTQRALSKCRNCGQLPSYFQEMTLCMMVDWMADNWQRCLQQSFIRPRSATFLRSCEETPQQPSTSGSEMCCLRVGSTRVDDMTWRICVQDLVKLRLIRLARLLKSIACAVGHPESSRNKKSTLKLAVDALRREANSKIEMVLGMMGSYKS